MSVRWRFEWRTLQSQVLDRRVRESTVVRLVLVHCLGKAGSLGEGGTADLAAAGEETQIVKDLGLVTILLLVVTDEKSPH